MHIQDINKLYILLIRECAYMVVRYKQLQAFNSQRQERDHQRGPVCVQIGEFVLRRTCINYAVIYKPHCGIQQTKITLETAEFDDQARLMARIFIQTKQAVALWVHGSSGKTVGMKIRGA